MQCSGALAGLEHIEAIVHSLPEVSGRMSAESVLDSVLNCE